jgi:anti-sigma regulatory factor (Ser/Thr protein kinase)
MPAVPSSAQRADAPARAAAPSPPASGPLGPAPPPRHQAINCGPWPHQDAMEFGALPGAVPCARLHARHVLWEWGLARQAGDAELLVSELVTNAIAASRSAGYPFPVRLWLLADRTRVLILVWDASPQPPVPVDVAEDDESGRGLLLVQAISQRWNWYYPQQADGKVVWALVGTAST